MVFAVRRSHGPSWEPLSLHEQAQWLPHAYFIDDLVREGFVLLAGPLGADGALIIVEAADEAAVNARLEADPWTLSGHLITTSVLAWDVLVGEIADSTRTPREQDQPIV